MDNLPTPAERREAYLAGIAAFGFSDRDKQRIRLLAEEVTEHSSPAALDDLSVPIRVGACLLEKRRHLGGEVLGTLTRADGVKIALLYWKISRGMEMEAWERRTEPRRG